MKIITCKYTYLNGEYKKDIAVAFNKKIEKIAPLDELKKEYPEAKIINYDKNSTLYPGFINPHVHLEFCANKAMLNYGNFIEWLYSVLKFREELVKKLDNNLMVDATKQMLKSGVTTFGEISSFGAELEVCKNIKQRVVYFNEIIGSTPGAIDALFSDLKNRLQDSINASSDKLIPAVAVHSAYSVHPILLRETLNIAKNKKLLTTAHFLESKAEREWLEEGKGEFLEFFKNFSNTTKPLTTIKEFLNAFNGYPTLFTHAAEATKEELELINNQGHSIIHCPRSNRLLDCSRAKIEYVDNLLIGTDGLSSNYSLSILDECKAALMLHHKANIKELAARLIKAITINAAKALKLPIGKIEPNYHADFAIFTLPDDLKEETNGNLALHTIINCNKADSVYIAGEEVSL